MHEKSTIDYAFFHLDLQHNDASVSKHPDEARLGTHGIKKQTSFYLVLESPANKKRCVKLDATKPWTENLRERCVVEFPQVLVTSKQLPDMLGWEVVRDERKIVMLEDDTNPKAEDVTVESKATVEVTPAAQAPKAMALSNELSGSQLEKRKQPDDDISIDSTLAAIKRARKE